MRQSRLQLFNRHPLNVAIHFGFAMSLAAMPTLVQADDETSLHNNTPVADLENITIYAESYRTTGTKSALEPEEAPLSYTRIDQKVLEERYADSIGAALRYDPGVSSESRGTVTLFDEYRLRGFEVQGNYYDGMRLAYDGVWNLRPQVDSYATEAVEVVKGSSSSLYGYGSPGGLVNQIAKNPQSIPSHQLRLRGGDNNLAEIAIDSTGALTDNLNYRFVALGRQKDGQMETTKEERIMVNPSLEWQPTDNLSVLASVYYQDDPEQVPSTPLPSVGTVYDASYGKLGSNGYAGDEWNHYDKNVLMPSMTINWDINDNLTFKHASRYTDAEGTQRNMYNRGFLSDYKTSPQSTDLIDKYYPNNETLLVRDAYTTDETLKNYATDNQLAFEFDTGNVTHNMLFGVEYQKTDSTAVYKDAGSVDTKTLQAKTPLLDLSNPNYKLINAGTLPLNDYVQEDDISQSQIGYYLQDEVTIDKLTVVAGLRYDDFESTNNQTESAAGTQFADTKIINEDKETSGRIAAIYQFDNGIAPFASYSQSFQPNVGANYWTKEPFKATTADQIEAGFKYSDNRTDASFALYTIKQENVRVSHPVEYTRQTQTGEIESQGFEVSANTVVNDWMDLGFSYSLTDAEITKDEFNPEVVGNAPQQVAKNKATLWTSIYPTDKLKLNAGVRYQSGMEIDRPNSDTLPDVTLVDVSGSYDINSWLQAGFSVSNVFDKEYVGTCYDRNNCWMGQERQASVSLTAEF